MSRWLKPIDRPLRFDASHNGYTECEEDFGHQGTLNLGAAMADPPLRGQEPEERTSSPRLDHKHTIPKTIDPRRGVAARWERLDQMTREAKQVAEERAAYIEHAAQKLATASDVTIEQARRVLADVLKGLQ